MITSVRDWIVFLNDSHSGIGFLLVVAGLGLMLFGWRMWKVCMMLAYGVIGAAIGASLFGQGDNQWLWALGSGAVLGLVSYWPVNYAVASLGGIIGAGIIMHSLAKVGLSGAGLWAAGGAAFATCSAFAFLNRQHVVVAVTAFFGAVLLVSGLTSWVMASPGLYGTLHAMAAGSAVVIPFVLLVPTVVSCLYQSAEVRRNSVSL